MEEETNVTTVTKVDKSCSQLCTPPYASPAPDGTSCCNFSFKHLLVSAAVDPGTLDLLILLIWHNLSSFLNIFSYLVVVTESHTCASRLRPKRKVCEDYVSCFGSGRNGRGGVV